MLTQILSISMTNSHSTLATSDHGCLQYLLGKAKVRWTCRYRYREKLIRKIKVRANKLNLAFSKELSILAVTAHSVTKLALKVDLDVSLWQ
jgi:hypothetical protein